MENSQRVWIMYIIVLSLNFLTVNELSTERHFIVWAVKLNQHGYYKGIMTSKFGFKYMLLWKEVVFLFSQRMRNYALSPDHYDLTEQDSLNGCCKHPDKENTLPNKEQEIVQRNYTHISK